MSPQPDNIQGSRELRVYGRSDLYFFSGKRVLKR